MSNNDLFSLLQISHADQSRIGPEATGDSGITPTTSGGLLSSSLSLRGDTSHNNNQSAHDSGAPSPSGHSTPNQHNKAMTPTAIAEHLRRQLDEISNNSTANNNNNSIALLGASTSSLGRRATVDDDEEEDGNKTTLTGLSFRRVTGSGALDGSPTAIAIGLLGAAENGGDVDSIAIGSHDDGVRSDYDYDKNKDDDDDHHFGDKESLYASAMAAAATGDLSTTTSGLGTASGGGSGLPRFNPFSDESEQPMSGVPNAAAAAEVDYYDPSRVDNDDVIDAALRHLQAGESASQAVALPPAAVDVQQHPQHQAPAAAPVSPQQQQHATFVIHNSQALVELFAESHSHSHRGGGFPDAGSHLSEESDPGQASAIRLEALLMGGSTSNLGADEQQSHHLPSPVSGADEHHQHQHVSAAGDADALLRVRVLVGRRNNNVGASAMSQSSGEDDTNLLAMIDDQQSGESLSMDLQHGDESVATVQDSQAEHIGLLIRRDFEIFRTYLQLRPELGSVIFHHTTTNTTEQ